MDAPSPHVAAAKQTKVKILPSFFFRAFQKRNKVISKLVSTIKKDDIAKKFIFYLPIIDILSNSILLSIFFKIK